MKQYQSHKIVRAGKIISTLADHERNGVTITVEGDEIPHLVTDAVAERIGEMAKNAGLEVTEGYLVYYADGYTSWSPAEAFEEGYTPVSDAIHPAPIEFGEADLAIDPILRYFHYAHLPESLAVHSRPFCELAMQIVRTLPRNPERTVALRKLLEAKDAAVRANIE
jgi:hypothetical protein